jgi:glutaredoxin
MNNYSLKAILLGNCPYSNSAYELLKIHNIPVETIWINQLNKENYKTNLINTFPQIYLKKNNSNGNLLLGGYDDLNNFISTFLKKKISDSNINFFMEKSKWSKKSTLRLIQLINKIN